MTPRDEQILRHIARHRLSIRPVLQQLFFKSSDAAGNVINRLVRAGMLESSKLPGGHSYYQLTDKGAQALGLQKAPRVRDVRGVPAALAALLSTSMEGER